MLSTKPAPDFQTRKQIVIISERLDADWSRKLAGRFEIIPLGHWSYREMHRAFNFTTEQYVWFGGYPGAAALIDNEERWARYVTDSLIETSISKDILMLTRVDKPAHMKQLFELGCGYSGQILSYTKMLGQLQDAGNTTTLAHYLNLLDTVGLLAGLEIKSGHSRALSGIELFQRQFNPKKLLLVGASGIPWQEFLQIDPLDLFR